MANKLDPMDLKQIITLHLDGYSNRKIGSTLGISRNTVNTYMQLFEGCKYSLQQLLSFDVEQLSELFSSFTTVDAQRHNDLMLYFETVNKARNHPGFTFLYHYTQYAQTMANPYSYTQFMEHYNRKYKEVKDLVSQQDYAFAYTLVKDLKKQYSESTQSDHAYINDDLNYFEILCAVKLNQQQAKEAAKDNAT